MATVDVITAQKALAIEAASVITGTIDGNSHLILTTQGGTNIDAGAVGGAADASTTVKGLVELATDAETATGTDTTRAVTPFGMASVIATATGRGLVELATNAEAAAGTDTSRAVTPANIKPLLDAKTSPYYNVKASGAVKGDGVTDDTTALNAVIAASPEGSTVFFPSGTYLISAPIVLLPSRAYLGGGQATGNSAATIKLKNGTNLTAAGGVTGLFVSQAFATNATLCDLPIRIDNMAFHGNVDNNATSTACGIVLISFWSTINACYIYDMPKHGIFLTDTGINGTTQITNSASENKITHCKIADTNGDGIHQYNSVAGANLDGLIADCYISGTGGSGIYFDRSPGWAVRRCHLYGIAENGIEMGFSFATTVSDCYIEDFGGKNVATTWYWGIGFTQLNDRGTHVVDNMISNGEPNAVTTTNYYYIRANVGSGQTTGKAVVTGNLLFGANRPNGSGVVCENNSGGLMTVVVRDNQISNIVTPYSISSAITIDPGLMGAVGTPTVAFGAQGSAAAATGAGVTNCAGQVTVTAKATGMAAGVLATITFSKPFAIVPKAVIISPTNGAAGSAPLYATWTASAITVSTNAAPTASQVFTFAYQVSPA